MLCFHRGRFHNQIPVWWQVKLQHLKSTLDWNQGMGDGRYLFCSQTLIIVSSSRHLSGTDHMQSPISAQPLLSAGSLIVHACTNNFPLPSGEVSNYYINWSKVSFNLSIADNQEQNNVLHICWLCCKNTCKNLGWHAKEYFFNMVLGKANVFGRITFL